MNMHAGYFVQRHPYHIVRKEGTRSWLLALTISGMGRFGYAGGSLIAKEGDAVLLKSRAFHDYAVAPQAEQWEFVWCHFHPWAHWMPYLEWPTVADGLSTLHLGGEVYEALEKSLREAVEAEGSVGIFGVARGMNSLERGLITVAERQSLVSRRELRVAPALAIIERHLSSNISISRMASVCGLSDSRFAHLFREELGVTPRAFVESQRIARAKQLLEMTPWPLQRIAEECGYPNAFYLSTRFTKTTGMSPTMFRSRDIEGRVGEAHL